MTTLYCAECGGRMEPDTDHVWVNAEFKRMRDRNTETEFAFCPECWNAKTDEWSDPV